MAKPLDLFLAEINKSFIAIKDNEYKKNHKIFDSVFKEVKTKMGEKCNYFKQYTSQVLIAGSVSDGVKVSKLDEFDMDVVIRLPINYQEIIIENDRAGFVKLKIKEPFDHLDKQPNWENCHKVTREWRDSEKYLLQDKFRQWLHGVMQKALDDLNNRVTVDGTTYLLTYKESGPAYTINVRNVNGDPEFYLDVDFVPVIRFMHPRWPQNYKQSEFKSKNWFVVPKPDKTVNDSTQKSRCWRLSFMEQESAIIKDRHQMKNILRLLKKLRNNLGMKAIASYYIKTLFLWKIQETEDKFWQNNLSSLFRIMVNELYEAVKKGQIKYYWHEKNNLLEKAKGLQDYAKKLEAVLKSIDDNDGDKLSSYLLSSDELQLFKESDYYRKNLATLQNGLSRTNSNASMASCSCDVTNEWKKRIEDTMVGLADEVKRIKMEMSKVTGENEDLKMEVKRLKRQKDYNDKFAKEMGKALFDSE